MKAGCPLLYTVPGYSVCISFTLIIILMSAVLQLVVSAQKRHRCFLDNTIKLIRLKDRGPQLMQKCVSV